MSFHLDPLINWSNSNCNNSCHFGVFFVSFTRTSVSFWWHFYVMFMSFSWPCTHPCHFGVILMSFLRLTMPFSCHFSVILMSFWVFFGVSILRLLMPFWCHFGVILVPIDLPTTQKGHVILVSFWCHFGVILVSFWCHFGVVASQVSWEARAFGRRLWPTVSCRGRVKCTGGTGGVASFTSSSIPFSG